MTAAERLRELIQDIDEIRSAYGYLLMQIALTDDLTLFEIGKKQEARGRDTFAKFERLLSRPGKSNHESWDLLTAEILDAALAEALPAQQVVCDHEWVTHMIELPTHSKPGRTACRKCGIDKPPQQFTATITPSGELAYVSQEAASAVLRRPQEMNMELCTCHVVSGGHVARVESCPLHGSASEGSVLRRPTPPPQIPDGCWSDEQYARIISNVPARGSDLAQRLLNAQELARSLGSVRSNPAAVMSISRELIALLREAATVVASREETKET